MREIKFRAWDKNGKGFIAGFNMIGAGIGAGIPQSLRRFNDEWKLEDVEIMQYTGLKDKNGNEIYEGDIVIMDSGTNEETKCVVEWLDGGFVLIGEGYNASPIGPQVIYGKSCEIIGNTYEHPYLLTA